MTPPNGTPPVSPRPPGPSPEPHAARAADESPAAVHGADARHVLSSAAGIEAELSSVGARLVALRMPDREGRVADLVLGTDDPRAPHARTSYFGATCGRFANRIRDGRLVVDGVEHRLTLNEGPTHLHGGLDGFDARDWQAVRSADGTAVEFLLRSPDGDQGYPGAVEARVSYRLAGRTLRIEMTAVADAPTVVNLANHAYWNLGGHAHGAILDHEVALHASRWLPVDARLIPTGEIRAVDGSPFDLRAGRRMADVLAARPEGFDHCFIVDGPMDAFRPVARVHHAASGRGFELHADQAGVQFYTCMHFADGLAGKGGATYRRFAALVLEPQRFPDAPSHPAFPSARLAPGETYRQVLEYRFFVD